jgi:glutaredoxin
MQVVVYSRDGCTLCEDLLDHLDALAPEHGFDYELRDVDARPDWQADYGSRVPLVLVDGEAVCQYFLDQAGLLARLGML